MASGGVMPSRKFSGHEGTVSIREYIEDFEWLATANAWTPERAAAFLVVHLDGDAKEFVRQLARTDPLSITTLAGLRDALIHRYENNAAVLRNRREWDERRRLPGESIHAYASGLRSCYDRAFPGPPKPEEPAHGADGDATVAQAEAAAIYKFAAAHRESVLLSKFINGLSVSQRDTLVRDESVLKSSLDDVIKRLARLEAELRATNVQAVSAHSDCDNVSEEQSVAEDGAVAAGAAVQAVSQRARPAKPRQRRGALSTDICRNCGGRGHWARDCASPLVQSELLPRRQGNDKGLATRARC